LPYHAPSVEVAALALSLSGHSRNEGLRRRRWPALLLAERAIMGTGWEESVSLLHLAKDLLSKSHQIVLDLGEDTRIDNGGLGTLVSLYASVRKVGGDIKLANLGSHAHELLQITKLLTVFEVFDKTEDAIASFNKAATAT
jgi:anti-sigma B factor antagonist